MLFQYLLNRIKYQYNLAQTNLNVSKKLAVGGKGGWSVQRYTEQTCKYTFSSSVFKRSEAGDYSEGVIQEYRERQKTRLWHNTDKFSSLSNCLKRRGKEVTYSQPRQPLSDLERARLASPVASDQNQMHCCELEVFHMDGGRRMDRQTLKQTQTGKSTQQTELGNRRTPTGREGVIKQTR